MICSGAYLFLTIYSPLYDIISGIVFGGQVTPDFQGKGIGSQMMKFYCDIIDRDRMEAYHETDRPENVRFYQRFGFKVVGEEIINGVKNWYMLRPAKLDK
jgi:ribosomal protein S18 acetylase RimI-like enzyme